MKENLLKNEELHKPYTPLTSANVFLVVGLTILIIGIIFGLLSYTTYTSGMPAHLYNGKLGTKYVEEIAAGDTDYKELAFTCFKIAGAGIIISAGGLILKCIKKLKTHRPLSDSTFDVGS